jgi:hypothetical protein
MCLIFYVAQQCFAQGQRNQLTEYIYQTLKQNEKGFPRPKLRDTVFVGVFDGASTEFEGIKSSRRFVTEPRPPHTIIFPGLYYSKAANTCLKFSVEDPGELFTVRVNGNVYTSTINQPDLVIPIGFTKIVNWEIQQGSNKHKDLLHVNRLIIGAGAFTMPYLPISFLYAPPVTQSNLNQSTYSRREAIGTTLALSTSTESSETKPRMTALNVFHQILAAGISSTANNPDPDIQAVNKALSIIKGAFGNESVTETVGKIKGNELLITANNIFEEEFHTSMPTQGYGHSDVILLLQNARVLWSVTNGALTYSVLDYERIVQLTADQMRQSTDPKLSALSILNPFSRNGGSRPRTPRFSFIRNSTRTLFPTTDYKFKVTKEQIQSQRSTNTYYHSEITDYTSGYLSFLGIGNETKTVKQTFTESAINEITVASSQINEIYLKNESSRPITIEFYYDNVFGGIVAYQIPEFELAPGAEGTMRYANGNVVPGTTVVLQINNKSYSTVTDKNGYYQIFIEKPATGKKGILSAGNNKKEIVLPVSASVKADFIIQQTKNNQPKD